MTTFLYPGFVTPRVPSALRLLRDVTLALWAFGVLGFCLAGIASAVL